MAKADVLTPTYTNGIVTKLASADPVVKAEGERELAEQNAIMRMPDVVIDPASLRADQIAGFADRPAAAKYHEANKIMENARNAAAKEQGIFSDVLKTVEGYQKMSLTSKLGMSAAFAACAGGAALIGGPLGLALGGIGLAGKLGQRFFGTLSTFMFSEALVNKGLQKVIGEEKVPKFVKWGLTALGAAGAFFVGKEAGELLAGGFRWMAQGVHDWAADWIAPKHAHVAEWFRPGPEHDYRTTTVEVDQHGQQINPSGSVSSKHRRRTHL